MVIFHIFPQGVVVELINANYRMKTTCVFLSTFENDYTRTRQESAGRGTCMFAIDEYYCLRLMQPWHQGGFKLWLVLSLISSIQCLISSVWNAPWSSAGKVSGRIFLILLFDGVFFAWRKISIIYQPISYTPRFVGSRWQSHVLVYHLTPY